MVWMPPQHGKSLICSKYTPAWYLSMWPHRHTLLASYEADFARGWGRKARDVCTVWGPKQFGYRVREDTHAADRWEIQHHGGSMQTSGLRGAISGKPGHLGVIDDPVKNAEEALSPTIQERNADWYFSSFKTRRQPGYTNLIIQTRWNEKDLSGKILVVEGDEWEVLRLPALAEEDDPLGRKPGEALWPDRFDAEYLRKLEAANPYWFAAMYQGSPQPRTGGMFGDWMVVEPNAVPGADTILRNGFELPLVCRYWDMASSEPKKGATDPDYTVGTKVLMSGGMFWVLDVARFRAEAADKERKISAVAHQDGPGVPIIIEQERGSAGKELIRNYARLLPRFSVHPDLPQGNKEARAENSSAKSANGTLRLVRAGWNDQFIDEHRTFPNGAHKDQVDACAGAVNWLIEMWEEGEEDVIEDYDEVQISPL